MKEYQIRVSPQVPYVVASEIVDRQLPPEVIQLMFLKNVHLFTDANGLSYFQAVKVRKNRKGQYESINITSDAYPSLNYAYCALELHIEYELNMTKRRFGLSDEFVYAYCSHVRDNTYINGQPDNLYLHLH